MKRRALVTAIVLLRCGDGTGKFTGAPWNVLEVVTVTCDGSATSTNDPETVTFTADGSQLKSIWFDWNDSCRFQWSVDGDTASLSNAPVDCSNTAGGDLGPYFTFASGTVTMWSDGHHLTTHLVGAQTTFGTPNVICAVEITGTAIR